MSLVTAFLRDKDGNFIDKGRLPLPTPLPAHFDECKRPSSWGIPCEPRGAAVS